MPFVVQDVIGRDGIAKCDHTICRRGCAHGGRSSTNLGKGPDPQTAPGFGTGDRPTRVENERVRRRCHEEVRQGARTEDAVTPKPRAVYASETNVSVS